MFAQEAPQATVSAKNSDGEQQKLRKQLQVVQQQLQVCPQCACSIRGWGGGKSTGRSGRQKAATRRNMRREERVTVQGPVKEQQSDGMSHRGANFVEGNCQGKIMREDLLCSSPPPPRLLRISGYLFARVPPIAIVFFFPNLGAVLSMLLVVLYLPHVEVLLLSLCVALAVAPFRLFRFIVTHFLRGQKRLMLIIFSQHHLGFV